MNDVPPTVLERAFASLDVGFCVILPHYDGAGRCVDYTFVAANAAFERHTGLADPVGRRVTELVPDLDAFWFETYGRVGTTGERVRFESPAPALGRTFEAVAYRLEPVHDADGPLVGILFTDVTERARAAEALSRAERERHDATRQLRFTLERMRDGLYLLDAAWRFTFVNAAAEHLLLRDAEALIGQVVWDAFPQTRGSELEALYRRVAATGAPGQIEFYYPPLERWYEVDAHPADGGVAAFFRVIDERKRADAALRASEERFRLIARATADVLYDWRVGNDEVWRFGGIDSADDLIDVRERISSLRGWVARIHPDDRERVGRALDAALAGDQTHYEQRYRRFDGEGGLRHVEDRAVIMRDEHGRARRMVGSMLDVTEAVQRAERDARGRRLEALGQLTGGVAHDFNNMLTVVLGNAELLEDALPEGPLQRVAATTRQAAERSADLTRRLLAFARRQALSPRHLDVGQQLLELEPLLRRTVGADVVFVVDVGAGRATAVADPGQLEQAVLNLVINARDASLAGGTVALEVDEVELDAVGAAEHELAPGRYARVRVHDTGSGMPPDVAARAFEPYFTTKGDGSGTGLGLSMVYGFARQSGGTALLSSTEGVGTTVDLLVPASPDGRVDEADDGGQRGSITGSEVILVVEDDPLVRDHVTSLVRSLGYDVLAAADGEAGLRLLAARDDVALLFTDVVMPGGMNGRALAEAARAQRPTLRVLFTSGYSYDALVRDGRLEGGVRLLTKPYRRAELAAAIRAALDAHDAAPT